MYLLLIILAAIFVAIQDVLTNRFNDSVFGKLNQFFWNPEVSKNIPTLFGIRLDARTIAKGLMWVTVLISIVCAQLPLFQIRWKLMPVFIQLIVATVIFIAAYNIFYKKVFIKKSK